MGKATGKTAADRVVISGMGVVSPIGVGLDAFLAGLRAGKSGVGPISHVDTSRLQTRIAGVVEDATMLPFWPEERPVEEFDRTTVFALIAADLAMSEGGLKGEDGVPLKQGVVVGTGLGPAQSYEDTYQDIYDDKASYIKPSAVTRMQANTPADEVARRFKLGRINNTVSTLCSSSLVALSVARQYILSGVLDRALVGGVDCPLTQAFLRSWDSYRIMTRNHNDAPATASRPFSSDRTGMVMAEGCGFVLLEREASARQRGAMIYAELAGVGQTSSIDRPFSGDPEPLATCMADALSDASMSTKEINSVFAHAPSTHMQDAGEWRAIQTVFGDFVPNVPVSAIKSMTGHTMGASGMLGVIAAAGAMAQNFVPPTINFTSPDPECEIDCVPNKARDFVVTSAMVNAFGFGGSNASVVLRKAD